MQFRAIIIASRYIYLAGQLIETLPRGRPPAGGRGGHGHVVNYRHVIHSLRTKPQALANLVYRDKLFPSSEYRRCWDALEAALPKAAACRTMVGLLWLAHDQACEAELAATLTGILDGQGLPDLKDLQQHFQRPGNEPADVAVDIPPSETYDALLGHKEMAA